jgi:hypothetical protein
MTDNGDPGSDDTISISVWNKNGGLWFASNWSGTKTVEQTLAGGNLVVNSVNRPLSVAGVPRLEPATDEPLLLTIDRLPEPASGAAPGRFVLRFSVVPKAVYALEHSDDLVTWTPLNTVMSLTNEVEYVGEAQSMAGLQFYRVRAIGEPVRDPVHSPVSQSQ